MKAPDLRQLVYRANRELADSGLVMGTFGNVSGIDRASGVFAIKPSGVPYEELTPAHMVLVSLETGASVESGLRPSSDTATHLELYRAFGSCGGIVHTHSEFATVFAQARTPIRCSHSRSSWIPSGSTLPSIQCHHTRGRASSGGSVKRDQSASIASSLTAPPAPSRASSCRRTRRS